MASGYIWKIVSAIRGRDPVHSVDGAWCLCGCGRDPLGRTSLVISQAWTLPPDRLGVSPRPGRARSCKPFWEAEISMGYSGDLGREADGVARPQWALLACPVRLARCLLVSGPFGFDPAPP